MQVISLQIMCIPAPVFYIKTRTFIQYYIIPALYAPMKFQTKIIIKILKTYLCEIERLTKGILIPVKLSVVNSRSQTRESC